MRRALANNAAGMHYWRMLSTIPADEYRDHLGPKLFELYREGLLVESLRREDGEDFMDARRRVCGRAQEVGALAFIRHHATWLEDAHGSFPCREVDAEHVAINTPLGDCILETRRAKVGELYLAVSTGPGMAAGYSTATVAVPPPVKASGRLNPPRWFDRGQWWWQPDSFTYEDGTVSGFLGSYPRKVTWPSGTPAWDFEAFERRVAP